jgi:hypothetical protein
MFSLKVLGITPTKFCVLTLCITGIISGCNGGDKDSSSPPVGAPTTEAPVAVPPPAGTDSKTLGGEFISANGMRVEVDNALRDSYGSSPPLHDAVKELAKFYQTWFSRTPATQADARSVVVEEGRLAQCVFSAASSKTEGRNASLDARLRTFNTKARQEARSEIYSLAGAFVLPDSFGSCAK